MININFIGIAVGLVLILQKFLSLSQQLGGGNEPQLKCMSER